MNPILLAATGNWLSNWLTPVWLVSLGALAGLICLLAIWLLSAIVSRLPGMAALHRRGGPAGRVSVGLGLVIFLALGAVLLLPTLTGAGEENQYVLSANLPMAAVLLLLGSQLLGFTLVALTSPRGAAEAIDAVREGPLWPIFGVVCLLSVFSVVGYFLATTPQSILASLKRISVLGTRTVTFTIPGTPQEKLDDPAQDPPQHPISLSFRQSELKLLVARADQNLSFDSQLNPGLDLNPVFRVNAGEEIRWIKSSETKGFGEADELQQLYVRNYGTGNANLALTLTTAPEHAEVTTVAMTAVATVAVFLLYLLQRSVMPRLSAIALATYKSEIAQPLFMIVMLIGVLAVIAFIWIPYNTLGEDIKMLKDTGMTLIMVLSIIQAVWAASTSVADEIEGRTALTVLSKPIGRQAFIGGKFLGIFWTVGVIFVVLGASFMISVAYKPIYDNKENNYKPIYEEHVIGNEDVTWQQVHYEMVGVVPGLVLAFLETVVLAAISVAISTRLPMLANFIICFSIYVLGHLTPLIVQSSVGKFAPVRFVAELLSTVLPILDHFNIQAAVSTGAVVPYEYLGWTLVYSLLYGLMALLLALVLFEDRDLA